MAFLCLLLPFNNFSLQKITDNFFYIPLSHLKKLKFDIYFSIDEGTLNFFNFKNKALPFLDINLHYEPTTVELFK